MLIGTYPTIYIPITPNKSAVDRKSPWTEINAFLSSKIPVLQDRKTWIA